MKEQSLDNYSHSTDFVEEGTKAEADAIMARKVIVVFIVVIRLIFGGVLMCAIEIKSMIV